MSHQGLSRFWVRKPQLLPLLLAVLLAALLVRLMYAVEMHFDIRLQLVAGCGLAALLVVLGRFKGLRRPPYRIAVLLLAGALSVRYLIWRTTDTLLYTGPLDVIGLSLLYAAEAYAITIHLLGLFISIWPVDRKPAPLPDNPEDYPSVDVFIPTYGEPSDLLRITLAAAVQIDYPKEKLRVHLLDDGGTVARRNNPATSSDAWARHHELLALADSMGVHYMTREENKGAKAGNVNHALAHTTGELVLVLDCDHVPTRDILRQSVGWFLKDPKLFLVQMPHFFINPTPVERNLRDPNVPFESDMFFRVIHAGLDSWNASYFCGSAAVLRRKYLVEAGGVAGTSITEDAETSVELHSRGYNSVFINRPVICGLSPETFDDYIIQRTRWAQGMLQIFVLKNPALQPGLSLPQRICYLNSCMFWFFSLARFTFYLAPALFLILGLQVYHATLPQIAAFVLPHIVGTYVVMSFVYGGTRLPLFSEIYESVQAIFLIPAVFSVLLNPQKPVFRITPKGTRLESRYLNHMATSFVFVVLVNLAAMPQAVLKYVQEPLYRDVVILAAGWCMFNIFMSLVSIGAFWENRQVRRFHRIMVSGEAEVWFPRRSVGLKGSLNDLSLTGLGVELEPSFRPDMREPVLLRATDSYGESYEIRAKLFRLIPHEGRKLLCGLEFEDLERDYMKIVRFVYGDSARWERTWLHRFEARGTPAKLGRFMLMGVKASVASTIDLTLTGLRWTIKGAAGLLGRMRQKPAPEAA